MPDPVNGNSSCFVADEETGGEGGSRYLEEIGVLGQDGLAMLTMEPTSGVIWNANRGAITLKITVKGRAAHVGLHHYQHTVIYALTAARLLGGYSDPK